MPPELLGPTGLLFALLVAVGVLWRDHMRADQEDRRQRDKLIVVVEGLVPALQELTATVRADIEDRSKRRRETDQ